MKQLMLVIGVGLFVALHTGTSMAATLKVLRVGTGEGKVIGGEIECGPFCEADYPPETIVHLEAIPRKDSTFEGWMVNGKPSEGALVIRDEDILVTAKFSKESDLDDNTIMWYSGNRKIYATIALDELIVFSADIDQWDLTTEGAYEADLRKIAECLHPEAQLTNGLLKWLKSPVPLTLAQLKESIAALMQLKQVGQVSPVLYQEQGFRTSSILTGEIIVKFPSHYADTRIQEIEQEYGLTRFEYEEPDPLGLFHYWVDGDALQAVEISKRLYESGLVEYAAPDELVEVELYQGDPASNSEQGQSDPWHLQKLGLPALWDRYEGAGTVVAILDDGVDYLHEDLEPNLRLQESYNYFDRRYAFGKEGRNLEYYLSLVCPIGSPDFSECKETHITQLQEALQFPFSIFGDALDQGDLRDSIHGTPVAGLIAARGNNDLGIRGIAPLAQLVGYRVNGIAIQADGTRREETSIDALRLALFKNLDTIHIYNASIGIRPFRYAPLIQDSLEKGTSAGKIYVVAAGNDWQQKGDNTNYTWLTKTRFPITVGACSDDDEPSWYSTPGANVLLCAPVDSFNLITGDLIEATSTTDVIGERGYNSEAHGETGDYPNRDYTRYFGGTSAAAPIVSGVIALMLQANRELTSRDVQHILILTAKKISPSHSSWSNNEHEIFPYSHKFGFGRIDAESAVDMAQSWEPLETVDTARGKESQDGQANVLTIDKNLSTEAVEILLTVDKPESVTLKSPLGTKSVLFPGNLPFAVGFIDELFTSMRHFREPSQGAWKLEVKDNNGDLMEDFDWSLVVYGTKLPPERSYVRKVTVSAGGDPIYSAGWMSLPSEEEEEEEEESSDEEETEQIVFLYYVEPQDPAAGAEAQIEIHSSEAMEDLSVRVAGEPDVDLDPCEASEDGTCWQGALTLPGTENSQLIIQGSDTAGQPLLPFADTTTKTLSEWAEEFDESGDTAHALGALPDPAWQLETPEESICSETERGVTCLFGGDDNGEGQGVVFLHPAEDGTELAAVLDEHDEAGASHSGVVWGSPSGLVLEIQPPRDDLELCEAHDDITTRCPHSWDYDPEEDAPPESEVHETELTWTLDATRQTEHCDLTVSWVVEGAEQAVTLAIEPASLCDAFVSEQKELPVTGSCAWTFEGGNYDWLKEELPPETSGPGASPVVSEYIDCQEYHSLRFGGSVSRGGCRENPLWETPPSWTYDVIEPGEPGFQREQTISVSYSGCQEWDDWLSKGDFRQTWPYDMVDLENGDEWVYQQKGRFPSSCLVEIVTVLWNPVGDCRYRYTPDSQSLEFPDGGIAVPLSGNQ